MHKETKYKFKGAMLPSMKIEILNLIKSGTLKENIANY
jgi:hypothetical protein